MKKSIIIGSRGSDLALWQAKHVQKLLKEECGLAADIQIIKTRGDQIQHLSFDKIEGKGFFTKEIENSLLNKSVDLAVHSYKDLETTQPTELVIAATGKRASSADLLLINKNAVDITNPLNLKKDAVVGTSSARRKSLLKLMRPDVIIKDIRGNVPTRIQKLANGEFDAIVLAQAGVDRLELDLTAFFNHKFNSKDFISAPAQGALALQIRKEDQWLFDALQVINDKSTEETVNIERSILKGFNAGCQVPLGVYCEKNESDYKVWISRAEKWEETPKQTFLKGTNAKNLIQSGLKLHSSNQTLQSVFVSREDNNDVFSTLLKTYSKNVQFTSCIKTSAVDFDINIPTSDWIFFSSQNSVNYFFKKIEPEAVSDRKIGVIGSSTQKTLNKYGLNATFIGTDETIKESAKSFSTQVLGSETVLFPISKVSLRSIQQQLKSNQVINVVVYNTQSEKNLVNLNNHDTYVFTSPSNVIGFFETYSEDISTKKVISIGQKTTEKLAEYGVLATVTAYEPSLLGLARTVLSIQ